jgi:uncharacterized membrane protein SpoIIM required for sporulation
MKETKFIAQKREKWAEYEDLLLQSNPDPEKLNELFVQITDDLSYARTFYPARSVRKYLNGLAQRVFHNIYKGRRLRTEEFRLFWTDGLPAVMWASRKALLLSFVIFVISFVIGVVSSRIDPDFAGVILGDDYVDMTISNIDNKDPMAVYKESRPLSMTFGIAANNLFVALQMALTGVLASIGTVFLMVYNGIMVGAFQYFFIERGLFWPSFLTIWIHGTLEISAIIIAGAAGLVAGSGLLFPGSYSRAQAFQVSMRRGLKIFLGIVPVLVLAAIFEGFLTRYTDSPAFLRGMIIGLSLFFVLWYFVWYPRHLATNGLFRKADYEYELQPTRVQEVHLDKIKNSGEVLSDAFALFRKHVGLILSSSFLCSLIFMGYAFLWSDKGVLETFSVTTEGFGDVLDASAEYFSSALVPGLFWVQCGILWVLCTCCFLAIGQNKAISSGEQDQHKRLGLHWLWTLALMPGAAYWLSIKPDHPALSFLLHLFTMPFILLLLAVAAAWFEGKNPFSAIGRAFYVCNWGQIFMIGLFSGLLSFMLLFVLGTPIWTRFVSLFTWLIPNENHNVAYFNVLVTVAASSFVTYATFALNVLFATLSYFSGVEEQDARALLARIEAVGKTPKIRGLARE